MFSPTLYCSSLLVKQSLVFNIFTITDKSRRFKEQTMSCPLKGFISPKFQSLGATTSKAQSQVILNLEQGIPHSR